MRGWRSKKKIIPVSERNKIHDWLSGDGGLRRAIKLMLRPVSLLAFLATILRNTASSTGLKLTIGLVAVITIGNDLGHGDEEEGRRGKGPEKQAYFFVMSYLWPSYFCRT